MTSEPTTASPSREPSLLAALVPVFALLGLLAGNVVVFEGTAHLPLVAATAVAALVARGLGHRWADLEDGILHGIGMAMKAILILLAIGMLIGTWIAAGIVPLLIDYGLRILSPAWFLPATCLICSVVSLATGSSWTTAGTVGLALVGVGVPLGFDPAVVAGAVVSGAYFGDKLSPLSDTTNLAPAVAGSELFEHVRHMLWTTIPSLAIAVAGYAILGFVSPPPPEAVADLGALRSTLATEFRLSPWLLSAPALVFVLVVRRTPALPALLAGVLAGAVLAVVVQGVAFGELLAAAQSGYRGDTGLATLDDLLTRGGFDSMYGTIGIILCAMAFGGVMERAGLLRRLAAAVLSLARGTGSLVAATLATCLGLNVVAPDQYLSIIVPGRMYREAYARAGLAPRNLSRCLEDAGTMTSPLVPWNTCGAYMAATLGVATGAYLPYAFLNLVTPLVSLVLGLTGWTMAKAPAATPER